MIPTETKNLHWKDAWFHLLNGKKIKRPLWEGYWVWENNTIMMHCRDGSVSDIRSTENVAYTMTNIAQRDWMVVIDNDREAGIDNDRKDGNVCHNCRHCIREWAGGDCLCRCEMSDECLGYVGNARVMNHWRRHWTKEKENDGTIRKNP